MAHTFQQDKSASDLHGRGLKLALHGKFAEAYKTFETAHQQVTASTEFDGNMTAVILQLSGIDRDHAFTLTREAMAKDKPELLNDSFSKLIGVRTSTSALLRQGEQLGHDDLDYIESAHGVVLDLMFRVAVVNKVVFKNAVSVTGPDTQLSGDPAWHAWYHLARGSNRYFSASHAMNAARYKLIEGDRTDARDWRAKAAAQIALARAQDPDNLRNVQRTVYGRRILLLGRQVAKASVRHWP